MRKEIKKNRDAAIEHIKTLELEEPLNAMLLKWIEKFPRMPTITARSQHEVLLEWQCVYPQERFLCVDVNGETGFSHFTWIGEFNSNVETEGIPALVQRFYKSEVMND